LFKHYSLVGTITIICETICWYFITGCFRVAPAAGSVAVSVTGDMTQKNHKKKQKRLQQLSRAADEELAEISLEQQVGQANHS